MIKPPSGVALLALRACAAALLQFSDLPAGEPQGPSDPDSQAAPSDPSGPGDNGGYGLLWLDVTPGDAAVALDGRFLDVGVWLVSVPPGSHDLLIRKDGCAPDAQRIDIEAGRSLHLDVHLEPDVPADSVFR